jgi:hypothetical protein
MKVSILAILKIFLIGFVIIIFYHGSAWSQSFEEFKNSETSLVDPSSIVQPIRWDASLSSEELNKIMSCPNYKKYGLLPTYTRETILSMHKDCCFKDGFNSITFGLILVVGALFLIGLGQLAINKRKE